MYVILTFCFTGFSLSLWSPDRDRCMHSHFLEKQNKSSWMGRVLCRTSAREVCGTDGQTYRNECMLCNKILHGNGCKAQERAWRRRIAGKASQATTNEDDSERIVCPYIIKQVCGTDGKTYSNECEICRHNLEFSNVKKKHDGVCLESIDCSEFQNKVAYCTRESSPHCGTDGHTYGNKCAFCKAVDVTGTQHYSNCTIFLP
uniref:Kazal-like domain-containing protein n=1 Tax=Varanus komodoensis TaxID=61221 RepID=A0A8D2LIW0_VARKO